MSTDSIRSEKKWRANRREADKAFSELLYQTVFETEGTATVIVDEDTTISHVNRGFEQLTGYLKRETEGKLNWKAFIEKGCQDKIAPYDSKRKTETCSALGTHEFQIVNRDGDKRDIYATVATIPGTKKSVAWLLDVTGRKRMEKTVRESEEKFRLLFEKSADAALLLDEDVFVDCNEAAIRLMGCSGKQQLIGLHPANLSPERQPDGRLSSEKAGELTRIALREGASRFEWVHRTFRGEELWVDVSLTVIPVRGRQIMYTVWRDIAERKKAEAQLRESEERYRVAIEHSNDGVMIVSGEKHLYVNQRLLDIFGYDRPEEITEGRHLLIIHPDHRAMVAQYVRMRQNGHAAPLRYEFKGVRKDGTELQMEASVAGVTYRGEPVLLTYLRDVTESRLAEAELRRSEEKYRQIFEHAMEGIFQTSIDGRFLSVNPAFARMFGYASPEEIMKKVTDIGCQLYADPEDRAKTLMILEEQNTLRNFEVEFLHREGFKIWVSTNYNTRRDANGKVLYYEGTCIDISERRLAEEALKKREKELQVKSINLEEANTALKVLLRHREEDKKTLENAILANVKEMVFPYVEKLKSSHLNENQLTYLNILESGLNDIVSPLLQKMTAIYARFTPMEIQVAELTRIGKTSKEVSALLGLSKRTIDTHKDNIRKKLDLSNKKVNLQAYLKTI